MRGRRQCQLSQVYGARSKKKSREEREKFKKESPPSPSVEIIFTQRKKGKTNYDYLLFSAFFLFLLSPLVFLLFAVTGEEEEEEEVPLKRKRRETPPSSLSSFLDCFMVGWSRLGDEGDREKRVGGRRDIMGRGIGKNQKERKKLFPDIERKKYCFQKKFKRLHVHRLFFENISNHAIRKRNPELVNFFTLLSGPFRQNFWG